MSFRRSPRRPLEKIVMSSRLALACVSLIVLAGCSMPAEQMPVAALHADEAQRASMPPMPGMGAAASPMSDADMIKSAMAAAPDAVSKDATIIAMDDKM